MEPDRADLAGRPELHLASRAATELVVKSSLEVAAALAAALVEPALHDARGVKRPTQDQLELHAVGRHRAIGRRKNEIAWRARNRILEIGHELGRDRDDVGVAALGRVSAVGVGDGEEPVRKIDVGLAKVPFVQLSVGSLSDEDVVGRTGDEDVLSDGFDLFPSAEQSGHGDAPPSDLNDNAYVAGALRAALCMDGDTWPGTPT